MEFKSPAKKHTSHFIEVDSDFNLFESYCETWARIINCCYYSIFNKKPLETAIFHEAIFSFLQAIKVTRFYGLKIEDLQNKQLVKTKWREKSNIFSYYMITALLMTHIDCFMTFCERYNHNLLKFNEKHLKKYVAMIEAIFKSGNIELMYDEFGARGGGRSLKMVMHDVIS
tara:strand:- start:92 stop:604 length:513 start_codon:yes stop_codon:yes gene_type:complete